MARPTNKADLIEASNTAYEKLINLIDSLPQQAQTGNFTFETGKLTGEHWKRDRNVRDVLIHLYEWQKLLLEWVEKNQAGEAQDFLPDGYNWRNYGEMNQQLWQKHQKTGLKEAEELLAESHQQVMKLLTTFSNDQLFTKNVFSWTGNNTLGTYFISNTSSHYEWALKKLRKYKRSLKQ